jgi:aspartate kinase
MQPTIMKFGGTSVEGATAFQNAARIVFERRELRPVVVVSAMSGFTDALLEGVQVALDSGPTEGLSHIEKHFDRHQRVIEALLLNEAPRMRALVERSRDEVGKLFKRASTEAAGQKERRKFFDDAVVSYGERLSAAMLAAVLSENNVSAEAVDPRNCIITDDHHGSATPLMDQTFGSTKQQLMPLFDANCIPVMGGFVGSTKNGDTTTLGRGGSDYTAAIVGAAVNAKEIQIWTDVPGVLTADPRVAPKARTVPQLSFEEAAELAYFGAKVLHPKTLYPAIERNIPVRICNSRAQESGSTLVLAETQKSPQTVKAIAHKTGVTTVQVTSARMLGAYGFLRALFEIFDRHRTAVDVVTTSEVSVSLSLDDTTALPAIVEELERLGSVSIEGKRAILCIVGEGLRSTPGIAARIFSTISDINVSLISQGASRINLTFAVEEARAREAVMRLHKEFFEETVSEKVAVENEEVGLRALS